MIKLSSFCPNITSKCNTIYSIFAYVYFFKQLSVTFIFADTQIYSSDLDRVCVRYILINCGIYKITDKNKCAYVYTYVHTQQDN